MANDRLPSDAPTAAEPSQPETGKRLQANVHVENTPNEAGETPVSILMDALKGPLSGTADFVESGGDLATDIADMVGLPAAINISRDGIKFLSKEELDAAGGDPVFGKEGSQDAADFIGVGQPQTIAGELTNGITQFTLGYLTGGKIFKALGVGAKQLGTVGNTIAKSAVGDFISFEEHEGRLSNLIADHTELEVPIIEYLAASPDDHWAEGRFKNLLEGAVIGGSVEGLFRIVKAYKGAKLADEAGNPQEAEKILREAQPEIDKAVDLEVGQFSEKPKATPGETAVKQAEDTDELAASLEPKDGPNTAPEYLASKGIKQVLDDQAITEAAQRLARGDGSLDEVSDAFNIAKYKTADDGLEALDLVIEKLKETDPETFGGVQTDAMVKRMAHAMGTDRTVFWKNMEDFAAKAEEMPAMIYRAHAEIAQVSSQLPAILSKYLSYKELGEDATAQVLQDKAMIGLNMVAKWVGVTKQAQTGIARSLAIHRNVRELRNIFASDKSSEEVARLFREYTDGFGGDFDSFAAKMSKVGNKPFWATRLLSMVLQNKFWDVSNEFFINSILSGPKTHVVNITSNFGETLLNPLERAAGSVIRGNFKAAKADLVTYAGMVHSLKDSWQLALSALKQEDNILDKINRTNELAHRKAITQENLLAAGAQGGRLGATVDNLGKGLRMPSRLLQAEDEFFKQLNYRAWVYSKAYGQALEQGMSGKAASRFASDKVLKAFDQATGAANNLDALEYARKVTFTNDLDKEFMWGIGAGIQRGVNYAAPLRQILPFVRTPTNLIRHTISRTPLGILLDQKVRDDLFGVNGSVAQSEAMSRMAIGTSVGGLAAYLAIDNKIVGREPRDPDLKRAFYDAGKLPYSFVSPDGTYYQFNRGDPRFQVFGIVADIIAVMDDLDPKVQDSLGAAVVQSVVKNLTSKSYLSGLEQTLEAMTTDDPDVFNNWYFRNLAPRVIPYSALLRQVNPDRELKVLRSHLDGIMAGLPGYSEQVEAKRNVFGEKVEKAFDGYILPFAMSTEASEGVKKEMGELGERFPLIPKRVPGTRVDLTKYKSPSGQTAWDRWQELSGTVRIGKYNMMQRLNAEVEKKGYQNAASLPDVTHIRSEKANRLGQIISAYRDKAWREMRNHPHWQQMFEDIKAERRATKKVKRQGSSALPDLLNF